MADLPTVRRMRRFRDKELGEYDELPDGKLRRRLKNGDTSSLPSPQSREVIEEREGLLVEIDAAVLATAKGWRRRCTRCSNSNCRGCTGTTKTGERRR